MRIAWITSEGNTDPIAGRVHPPVVEAGGQLTSTVASNRLRLLIPKAALEARGHAVELLQIDSASFDASVARLREFDAVVFKKTMELERGQLVADLLDRTDRVRAFPALFDICDSRFDPASETGRRNVRMLRAVLTG